MWVVKIGGSLGADPLLTQWLELLADVGGGRVTLVCGGGRFADEVRRTQRHWRLDDLAAHNMAILAMAQTAYMLHAMNPALCLTVSQSDIRRVLQKGHSALWLPLDLLREQPDANTSWDVSSDSIALNLARQLNAECLVVVKSCDIEPGASLAQLSDRGVLDARFAPLAEGASFPIEVVSKSELPRMRSLLLGEARPAA